MKKQTLRNLSSLFAFVSLVFTFGSLNAHAERCELDSHSQLIAGEAGMIIGSLQDGSPDSEICFSLGSLTSQIQTLSNHARSNTPEACRKLLADLLDATSENRQRCASSTALPRRGLEDSLTKIYDVAGKLMVKEE
ncbi:MAG: hypothetical protein H7301_12130 [Cryobacterium sp.]|nr:hypothetical protein [Oligoflexia bacterium]